MSGDKAFTGGEMDRRLDPQRRCLVEQANAFRHAGREVLMNVRQKLLSGLAIPAHPLALTAERKLDERRQRALTRYYLAAGAGGIAVGVHTTQFAIRNPKFALLRPVLELAMGEMRGSEVRLSVRLGLLSADARYLYNFPAPHLFHGQFQDRSQ